MKFRGINSHNRGYDEIKQSRLIPNPKQPASSGDWMEAGTIGDTQEVVLESGLEAESDSFQKEFKPSLPPLHNPVLFA